ncbi:MAG TPA: type VI secretion system tip protein TssI/VgrG [Stellaceae bacterium]|nr:type VI secretion system tip protein TssI/VgrG [Stellaceae bacterium]
MARELTLSFTVQAAGAPALSAWRVTGREAISEPYCFDVDLYAEQDNAAGASLIGKRGSLTMEIEDRKRVIDGVITRFEQLDAIHGSFAAYRARIEPSLVRLRMSRQNRIFGTIAPMSYPDIVTALLTGNADRRLGIEDSASMTADDYTLSLTQTYPSKDYTVQYDESDLAFVSRLMERLGIFYFFDERHAKDVMVIADADVAFPDLAFDIPYLPPTLGRAQQSQTRHVSRFSVAWSPVTRRLWVSDYNPDSPQVKLSKETLVDKSGTGSIHDYGSHIRDEGGLNRYSQVRAEELAARGTVFSGESDEIGLVAGSRVRLVEHPVSRFNQRYLIVAVSHEAAVPIPGVPTGGLAPAQWRYLNRFEWIPGTTPFRPAQRTPWPRMPGVTTGTVVDTLGRDDPNSGYAPMDADGRYKVRLPLDVSGTADTNASCWIRMAQANVGAHSGIHFPLLVGTEVIIAHINGDPDLPVIVGAVPNKANKSVVNSDFPGSNRIKTQSGIFVEMFDGGTRNNSGS